MSLHRVFLLLLSLLASAAPAHAEIFKYYDSNGNLVLTDAPPKDKAAKAERIESKPVMTIPAFKGGKAKNVSDAARTKGTSMNYTIVIQSPVNEATFRRSDDAVPVSISVAPSLAADHRMVFLLDGTALGDNSMIKPDSLERGSHQLLVRVQDAEGKVQGSASSTFYIQSHSVLGPTGPKPKPK
ncbi:MAG: DUF4124 domain-containing protein [bacterium]|nr:DUF4124 domain-containing protein [bacterium]